YYHTMRIMSRRYDKIENEKNLYKNRLHALLQLSFPEIETIFKTKTTACRLIGEIGDINRFKSNKQLNAYVGIDIARYQSGNTHYKDRINKRGNRRLRSMLFFMIVSMLSAKGKNTNHITNYYY